MVEGTKYRIHHHQHRVGTLLRLTKNIVWPGGVRQKVGAMAIITRADEYTSDNEFGIPTYTVEFEDGQTADLVGQDTIGEHRDFVVEG